MPAYQYSPLLEGDIRLLRLTPSQDEASPIRCRLLDYPLVENKKGTHLYEALSYIWGSPDKPCRVHTDVGYISVTRNLHAALIRLRDALLPRIIWIDGICINQDDIAERGRQVLMMAKIFAYANRVVVWLDDIAIEGQPTGSIDSGLRAIADLAQTEPRKEITPSSSQMIMSVLRHPWFHRVWIVQEVAAARHIIVMSNSYEIDGQGFCSGLHRFDLDRIAGSETIQRLLRNRMRTAVALIRDAPKRPRIAASATSSSFSLGTGSLNELIDLYHNREATDRRDKVFAILGMASGNLPSSLLPDYSVAWSELFSRLIHCCIAPKASVQIHDGKDMAIIESKISILGTIQLKRSNRFYDMQTVHVSFAAPQRQSDRNSRLPHRWLVQTPHPVYDHDLFCLCEGAQAPIIVRFAYGHHLTVVGVFVCPVTGTDPPGRMDNTTCSTPLLIQNAAPVLHRRLLVWDWKVPPPRPHQWRDMSWTEAQRPYSPTRYAPVSIADPFREAEYLQEIALHFAGISLFSPDTWGRNVWQEDAVRFIRQAISILETVAGGQDPRTIRAIDNLLYIYSAFPHPRVRGREQLISMTQIITNIVRRQGEFAALTEENVVKAVRQAAADAVGALVDLRAGEIPWSERILAEVATQAPDAFQMALFHAPSSVIDESILIESLGYVFTNLKNIDPFVCAMAKMTIQTDTTTLLESVLLGSGTRGTLARRVAEAFQVRFGERIRLTPKVFLLGVVGSNYDNDDVDFWLSLPGSQQCLTGEVVSESAKWASHGGRNGTRYESFSYLIHRCLALVGERFPVTDELIKAALDFEKVPRVETDPGLLQYLVEKLGRGMHVSPRVLRYAISLGGRTLQLLPLGNPGMEASITPEVVQRAAISTVWVMAILLEKQKAATMASITMRAFKAAAERGKIEVLDMLYESAPGAISDTAFKRLREESTALLGYSLRMKSGQRRGSESSSSEALENDDDWE